MLVHRSVEDLGSGSEDGGLYGQVTLEEAEVTWNTRTDDRWQQAHKAEEPAVSARVTRWGGWNRVQPRPAGHSALWA